MYDLTGFQRDLLYVIAGLDEPHGLAVNRLGVKPRGFPFPRRALQTHAESQVCP